MAKLNDLPGIFQRKGNKLQRDGLTLLLSERKEPTPKKPKYFIISLNGKVKGCYVSSLYPYEGDDDQKGRYWLEYDGQVYDIILEKDNAYISLKMAQERA